jgi:hypothetical protein
MDLDTTIARVKELIAERERIDGELAGLFGTSGLSPRRAPPTCSRCGAVGHRSTNCPGGSGQTAG